MPKGHWGHGSIKARSYAGESWIFPELDGTPDLRRGDLRLVADVVLAERDGGSVDADAREHALDTLIVMAKG